MSGRLGLLCGDEICAIDVPRKERSGERGSYLTMLVVNKSIATQELR